jgi:hypothetical protein
MSIKLLSEVITFLEQQPQDKIISFGFGSGDSYRGSFGDIGFSPLEDVSIKYMLACAKEMINKQHKGYKGGEYTTDEDSLCYIAEPNNNGDEINDTILKYWEC